MNKQLILSEIIYDSIFSMDSKSMKTFILEGLEKNNCSFKRFKEIIELQFISDRGMSETKTSALNNKLNAVFECEIKGTKEYQKYQNVNAFFNQFKVQF